MTKLTAQRGRSDADAWQWGAGPPSAQFASMAMVGLFPVVLSVLVSVGALAGELPWPLVFTAVVVVAVLVMIGRRIGVWWDGEVLTVQNRLSRFQIPAESIKEFKIQDLDLLPNAPIVLVVAFWDGPRLTKRQILATAAFPYGSRVREWYGQSFVSIGPGLRPGPASRYVGWFLGRPFRETGGNLRRHWGDPSEKRRRKRGRADGEPWQWGAGPMSAQVASMAYVGLLPASAAISLTALALGGDAPWPFLFSAIPVLALLVLIGRRIGVWWDGEVLTVRNRLSTFRIPATSIKEFKAIELDHWPGFPIVLVVVFWDGTHLKKRQVLATGAFPYRSKVREWYGRSFVSIGPGLRPGTAGMYAGLYLRFGPGGAREWFRY